MSPSAALQSPIFRSYLWFLLSVLICAGIVLTIAHFVLRRDTGLVWSTYRSWLVMAPLAAAAVFAGRIPFICGLTAIAILAFREFARVSGLTHDWWTVGVIYTGIIATGLYSLGVFSEATALVPLVTFGLILLGPILRNQTRDAVRRMSLGIIGFLYLGWMFGQLGSLANSANAYGYLCYLLLATELNDVAAFTFGKLFGRHPLRSAISPRKTWEGALGALAFSVALPWVLRFSFPYFGPWQLLLTGLIVGVGGQLGDLSLSVIKRDLGAKDMGASIPGHGGILDRIDSLIFTAPLFMLMALHYYPER
ncbi:MAG: phosphatidate cytidylyltransferase [Chthoniobacterales bacterium]|nr:phosphatidate cytidylyltransferase [Chthoniobacterales bacterium]